MGLEIKDDDVILKLKLNIVNIPDDDATMIECHNTMAIYMEPYIPMKEGILVGSAQVTADYVRYGGASAPYAHYQFEGIVYGPNIPIIEDGVIVGWFSPPNKQPTGEQLNYSTEKHPLATHHWHKAMMKDKSKEFTEDIKKIILDRLKKG